MYRGEIYIEGSRVSEPKIENVKDEERKDQVIG